MKMESDEIISVLREEISGFDNRTLRSETGTILDMGKTFYLEIISVDRQFYIGPAEGLILPIQDGQYGILAGHDEVNDAAAPFTAKAIEDLLVWGDGKRPGFLTVERA